MANIEDFNKNELWVVEKTLDERYGRTLELQLAESELRLDPHSTELTPCPTLFWQDDSGTSFVIFKVGDRRYRCLFYYRIREQYDTGVYEYDDLTECVVTLLQVHADHELTKAQKQDKG